VADREASLWEKRRAAPTTPSTIHRARPTLTRSLGWCQPMPASAHGARHQRVSDVQFGLESALRARGLHAVPLSGYHSRSTGARVALCGWSVAHPSRC